jgi:hypothetical protein
MYEKIGGISNFIISIVLLSIAALVIRRKGSEQPGVRFAGLSVKTILIFVYVAIVINIVAMVRVLLG